MKISFGAVVFAIFLIPTNYAAIRQQFLPTFAPPSMLFGMIILVAITATIACSHNAGSVIPGRLVIPYLTLNAWMLMSLLYSESFDFGLTKVIEFSTITMLACFAPVYMFRERVGVESFLKMILFLGILLAGLCVAGVIAFFRPGAEEQVMGQNYLAIQHIAGLAGIIVLYYFLPQSRGGSRVFIWIATLVLIMSALLITGGKGPVFTFVLTTMAIAALSFHRRSLVSVRVRNKVFLLYPFVILALGGIVLLGILATLEQSAFIDRLDFLFLEGNYNLAERVDNIGVAIDLFVENPLNGSGIGSFAAHSVDIEEAAERMRYPHNVLLEVLSELGIVGFMLLGYLLYSSYCYLRRLQISNEESQAPTVFLACLIFTFLNSLTSQYIANPALFAFIGAPYGLSHYLRRGQA